MPFIADDPTAKDALNNISDKLRKQPDEGVVIPEPKSFPLKAALMKARGYLTDTSIETVHIVNSTDLISLSHTNIVKILGMKCTANVGVLRFTFVGNNHIKLNKKVPAGCDMIFKYEYKL